MNAGNGRLGSLVDVHLVNRLAIIWASLDMSRAVVTAKGCCKMLSSSETTIEL